MYLSIHKYIPHIHVPHKIGLIDKSMHIDGLFDDGWIDRMMDMMIIIAVCYPFYIITLKGILLIFLIL